MSSSGWIQTLEKLKDALEHHVDEEENEVFPKAKKIISEEQAQLLADIFEARTGEELASA